MAKEKEHGKQYFRRKKKSQEVKDNFDLGSCGHEEHGEKTQHRDRKNREGRLLDKWNHSSESGAEATP